MNQATKAQVMQHLAIGQFYWIKHNRRIFEAGVLGVAKQLRKQGIPLEWALLILCGKWTGQASPLPISYCGE